MLQSDAVPEICLSRRKLVPTNVLYTKGDIYGEFVLINRRMMLHIIIYVRGLLLFYLATG